MIPNLLEDAERYANINPNLSEAFRMGLRGGYIEGRIKEHDRFKKMSREWLKKNYGHFDGSLDDLLSDYDKAMEEEI